MLAVPALLLLLGVSMASAEEISIGILVDLSGDLSTFGNNIAKTLEIAEEDINKYFAEKGLPYTVKFYVEDTKVDPKIALEKVQSLYSRGVRLIIGPMGSGEVGNIKNYVTSNKIIIISPSSTVLPTLLGVTKPEEKKYIFRFVGTDDLQTDAITDELKDLGIKAVAITYIGNAWGKGLYETIKPKLENASIEIVSHVEYPDPAPADFSPYITELEEAVSDAVKKYGNDKVAVVLFSYEEFVTILAQTKSTSPLLGVYWIGCDGTATSEKIADVCDKASKVYVLSTMFESKGESYDELKAKLEAKGYGEPYQYAMNAYDAAWVLALTYAEVVQERGGYDPDAMAEKIPEITKKYTNGEYGVYPVSGHIELNEWNDRATGDYAIWYVTKDCKWDKAGLWKFAEKKIEWFHKPSPPEMPKEEKRTPGFGVAAGIAATAAAYAARRRL